MNDALGTSVGVTSSRTLSGLVNGQPYIFRVRAANEAGWGEWSAFSAPVTPDTTPGRPSSPTVAFGDGQLTLTWAAPANEGSAITGYEVEIGGGHVGRRPTRHGHHVRVDGPAERHELPVPGHRDQRRRTVGPLAVVGSRAPAARARQPRGSGGGARQSLHRPVVGAVEPER